MQIYTLIRNYQQKSYVFYKIFLNSLILQGFQTQYFFTIILLYLHFVTK